MDSSLIKASQHSPPKLVPRFKHLVIKKLWPGTHVRAEKSRYFKIKSGEGHPQFSHLAMEDYEGQSWETKQQLEE